MLDIQRREEAGAVVLLLEGELDIASAPLFERRVAELWEEGVENVLLDLSGLLFVDSAGVSALIRAKEDASSKGREVVLRRPPAKVQSLFSLVGLANWLTFAD